MWAGWACSATARALDFCKPLLIRLAVGACLALMCCWSLPVGAQGSEGQTAPAGVAPQFTYDIDVTLESPERLSGTLTVRFANTSTRSIERIPLSLYAELFSTPDADLDDVNHPVRFPRGFSPGGTEVTGVRVNGRQVDVPSPSDGESEPTVRWLELGHGDAIPAGAEVEISLTFMTHIPHRFGLFGHAEGTVVLLGGWYPVVPRLADDRFQPEQPHAPSLLRCRFRSWSPGILALGNELATVAVDRSVEKRFTIDGPALLCFRRAYSLRKLRREGEDISLIMSGPHNAADESRRAMVDEVLRTTLAPIPAGAGDSPAPLFLAIEAPLRESMAVPFAGGVLYSDLLLQVTPFKRLTAQHLDNLRSAVLAAHLLGRRGMSLFDALLAINCIQFLRMETGQSDPLFLRRSLEKLEVWGALDKVGTDPQAHFQSSMFFTPELPMDIRRSNALFAGEVPPARSVARLVILILGTEGPAAALRRALGTGMGLRKAVYVEGGEKNRAALDGAFGFTGTPLALRSVTRGDSGWTARVCKGAPAAIPLEVEAGAGTSRARFVSSCPEKCCDIRLRQSVGEERVRVDPLGVILQPSTDESHPRLDDRNHIDLKWMVTRFNATMGTGDRLPSGGFELVMQPRFDLRNRAFVAPSLTPGRVSMGAGWRFGLGRRVRPNFLSDSISVSLRAAAGIDESNGVFGPALTYVHYTRGSRMNPYAGNWSYAYLYPVAASGLDRFGARFGGMVSQVAGSSPDHVFAFRIQGDGRLGWTPDWDVPSTGGIEGLRAAGATMLSKAHRLGAGAEYRLMIVRNLNIPVFRLAWLTGLQLALFVDTAAISDSPAELFKEENLFVDAGTGLRFHFDVFGVIPSLVSFDFAYMPAVLGAATPGYNGVLSFYQPF